MSSVIVRPDLPTQLYPLKVRVRVPRVSNLGPAARERAMRAQFDQFVAYVAKDGYQWQPQYGVKMLNGPLPIVDPKPLPQRREHSRLPLGPHPRGDVAPYDRSHMLGVQDVRLADEVEWELGGYFTRVTIQMEALVDDIAALDAKRRANGR